MARKASKSSFFWRALMDFLGKAKPHPEGKTATYVKAVEHAANLAPSLYEINGKRIIL